MDRDIDRIIKRLKTEIPEAEIVQLKVPHPGVDDDGLWFIDVPGREKNVQIESSHGKCPFLIESNFDAGAYQEGTVDDVVARIKRLYSL